MCRSLKKFGFDIWCMNRDRPFLNVSILLDSENLDTMFAGFKDINESTGRCHVVNCLNDLISIIYLLTDIFVVIGDI